MIRYCLATCFFLLYSTWVYSAEYGFNIDRASLEQQGNDYVLNADINYRFSPKAKEALANGVPLTLAVSVKVDRLRKYIWNRTILDAALLFRLRYHALADMYQIINESSGVQRSFVSLDAAIEALGTLRSIPVLAAHRVKPQYRHTASVKTQLDIESLPLPLRPIAYISPQWYLSSEWLVWSLEK